MRTLRQIVGEVNGNGNGAWQLAFQETPGVPSLEWSVQEYRVVRKQRFRNVGAGKGVKETLDAATLRRLYVDEGLPQAEIARRYGCSHQFVSQLLHEYSLR